MLKKYIIGLMLALTVNMVFADNEYTKQYGVSQIVPASKVFPNFKSGGILKPPTSNLPITVVIASTSEIKKDATKDFFADDSVFDKKKIKFLTVKAESNIADQPIGLKSAILGASNRISSAKKIRQQQGLSTVPNIYYVAIENFFSEMQDNGKPTDHALVIIETPDGKQHMYLSEGVEICRDIYAIVVTPQNMTMDKTGAKSTIGEYLSFKYRVSKNDWFSYVLDKTYTRQQQISMAFKQAME